MEITLHPTTKIVEVVTSGGTIQAGVWDGHTASV